jgi:protein-tyrosine phosphatase
MYQVEETSLWLGHVAEARNLRPVFDREVVAIVDLAAAELPLALPRDLAYFRFPLVDGAGNLPWLLRAAVNAVVGLIGSNTTTLVCCSAGMSRSRAVAAAAVARVRRCSLAVGLAAVAQRGPVDVSPGLWKDIVVLTGE